MRVKRSSMRDFAHLVSEKEIVCYGIGKEFSQIISAYQGYEWIDKIGYLVDNNPEKKGETFRIGDKKYTINNLEELRKIPSENIVIFPTCAAFADIIEELNSYSWLDDVDCYVFHYMFNVSEGKIEKIRQTDDVIIPPRIHYCWFGGNPLPERYKRYIDSWERYCPDYEIIEWNESNLDINETAFTSEAYKAGKFGFVPDYFRLKIIYEYGGIYLDTDVEVIKSLDDLRYNEAFCGMEYPGITAFGLGFGAVAHNEIIRGLMSFYKTKHFVNPDGSYDMTPSPVIQSNMIVDIGMKKSASFQNFKGLSVYPVDVLSPKNPYTGELRISENTYTIHHFDGTWMDSQEKVKKHEKLKKAADIISLF